MSRFHYFSVTASVASWRDMHDDVKLSWRRRSLTAPRHYTTASTPCPSLTFRHARFPHRLRQRLSRSPPAPHCHGMLRLDVSPPPCASSTPTKTASQRASREEKTHPPQRPDRLHPVCRMPPPPCWPFSRTPPPVAGQPHPNRRRPGSLRRNAPHRRPGHMSINLWSNGSRTRLGMRGGVHNRCIG